MQQQQNVIDSSHSAIEMLEEEEEEEEVEEEEEEEYNPGGETRPPSKRTKNVRLDTYAVTLDLPDLRVKNDVLCHIVNGGERYFFLKSVEKFTGCIHKTVRALKEQNVEAIMARDIGRGNANRLVMNLANLGVYLVANTKWSAADCGRIIAQLSNKTAVIKTQQRQPRQQRRMRQREDDDTPITQEYLETFLEEMRGMVEQAVANIGPATMVLYKRSPEFYEKVQDEVTARADLLLPAAIAKIEAKIEANLARSTAKKFKERKEKELDDKIKRLDKTTELRAMKTVLTSADYANDDTPIDLDKIAEDIYPSKKKRSRPANHDDDDSQ